MSLPSWVYPSGAEDVGWWQSNRPRVNQQIQLGMVGSLARIAGSIQPVAILDDLSSLSDVFGIYWYGGAVGTPLVGITPFLEVHAAPESDVDTFVYCAQWINQGVGSAAVVRANIRQPNPATNLAVISGRATQLSDGYRGASNPRHQVFIGDATRVGFNWGVGVNDASGLWHIYSDGTDNDGIFRFGTYGWRIPRGQNFCLGDELNGPTVSAYLGAVVVESKAPTGPV